MHNLRVFHFKREKNKLKIVRYLNVHVINVKEWQKIFSLLILAYVLNSLYFTYFIEVMVDLTKHAHVQI